MRSLVGIMRESGIIMISMRVIAFLTSLNRKNSGLMFGFSMKCSIARVVTVRQQSNLARMMSQYRINISGTGIREMLRHGIMPPKEIVRPESARIAIQGVQPKGLDEFENAITPVGKTIKSMFPFYLERTRLGGRKRKTPLTVEELTNDDLEMVNLDVRANANRIYQDVFNEYSSVGDTNRGMQPEWVMDARESLQTQQRMVIQDLEEKVKQAPETASDEFMYQDKEEALRELEVAKKILGDIPKVLRASDFDYRTWNSCHTNATAAPTIRMREK